MEINMPWLLFGVLISSSLQGQDLPNSIRLDQEGFYPNAPKIAIVTNRPDSGISNPRTGFFVVDEKSGDTVFRGKLSDFRKSRNSSLQTCSADFSALNTPGTFRVSVSDTDISYPFRIESKVHHTAAVASLKAYYFQRASSSLDPEFAGKWSRRAGHPDDSVIVHPSAASIKRKAGTTISTPGGWYDAGDYNKYIVNSGISMGTLLSAYEDFKPYFDSLRTNIPAQQKPIPDFLNEIVYNLRWMLSMQDPNDGGVYNKCTNATFDPMIMPDSARRPRYVVQKGTAATLDLTAVAAQTARILVNYENELPGLRDSCLRAAEKGWDWSLANSNLVYDQNSMNQLFEPKIVTGGYGDKKFTDEWTWASCELWISTGKRKYLDAVKKYTGQAETSSNDQLKLPSWSETGLLGFYSLLRYKKKAEKAGLNKELKFINTYLTRMADDYIKAADENAFLTVMGGRKSDFNWGSNSNAANQGILLLQVYFTTKNQKYLIAALSNLEYILGRNATGYCFITGIGSLSPQHPHHRPSVADGVAEPVPGLLVGGPNPGEQDHCTYNFHEPETAYSDSDCSYASNEIAINWNAPLVYLANALEFLENNFNYKK